jgi:UDP-N-acetylglucosamine--N-acetylmuramyl-(pentapeptide) pyrophosphoryl-undecaprenol N-acetylglucosamine transferase
MKILFSGGGTLGPVVPLLAIAEIYKKYDPQAEFFWIGTEHGPERDLIAEYGIPFFTIMSGKLRRYFSIWNFFDIFRIFFGFFQSLFFLWQKKPDIVITAGGFVSVPLHFAAFMLAIPAWVHQQDAQVGLANKIMSYTAKKVTTALLDTQLFFTENKTEWIGNPVRDLSVKNINKSRGKFGIPADAPVILAMGGGTGSSNINNLIMEALPKWPREWHVIHLVGRERPRALQERATGVFTNYHVYQFLKEEMKDAYAIADVVITRAGFATITELAALGKPAIILPIAGTHQDVNAKLLSDNQAAIVLDEKTDNGLKLARIVANLVDSEESRLSLGKQLKKILPPADPAKVVSIVDSLIS